VHPGGTLAVPFPRHVGQLPVSYNRRPTSFRWYVDLTREPLWPFGYGLSYTTFTVSNVRVTPATIAPDGTAQVSADVTNTGVRAGDEVVQLYVQHLGSTVERPIRELKGYKRVALKPGETRMVELPLAAASLAYWDSGGHHWVVEPEAVRIQVGASSTDIRLEKSITVTGLR